MTTLSLFRRCYSLICGLLMLSAVAGCGDQELPDEYGRRYNSGLGQSVNGTGVLSDLFAQKGWQVTSARTFTPRLQNASENQVIVWTPDNYQSPSATNRTWLEEWLRLGNGRTVIYIGRDYDAAPLYWSKISADATADSETPEYVANRIAARLGEAKVKESSARGSFPKSEDANWFRMVDKPKRKFDSFTGRWSEGLVAKEVEIEAAGRLLPPTQQKAAGAAIEPDNDDDSDDEMQAPSVPPPSVRGRSGPVPMIPPKFGASGRFNNAFDPNVRVEEILLAGNQEPLAFSVRSNRFGNGRVIVIVNGSWLTNLPLVNREHRKLAARLVDHCNAPTRKGAVVFLESGASGVPVRTTDSEGQLPQGFAMLTVWPLNLVILQSAVVGLLFLFSKYPIFGRARRVAGEPPADFARHIDALARLSARSNDATSARRWLAQYFDQARRESGASHARPAAKAASTPSQPQASQTVPPPLPTVS